MRPSETALARVLAHTEWAIVWSYRAMTHGKTSVSWWGTTAPVTLATGTTAIWAGIHMEFAVPGRVFGFRLFRDGSYDGNGWAIFWNYDTFETHCATRFKVAKTPPSTWHQTWIHPTVRVAVGTGYGLDIIFPNGKFYRTNSALGSHVTHNNIIFFAGRTTTLLVPVSHAPTENTNAYGVDVLFSPD